MYWVFAFVSIVLISGTMATLYFAYLGWMLRRSTGAVAFIGLMLSISFWSLSYSLEQFTPLLEEKIFWHKMAYIAIPLVPLTWFAFNAQILGYRFASRRLWLGLLAIVPLSMTLLTWTYEWHPWMWGEYAIEYNQGISYLVVDRNPEYLYYAAYSYLLILLGIILFVKNLLQSPSIGVPLITLMALAVITAVLFNVFQVVYPGGFLGPYDLSPITLATIGVIAGWFVFRFGPLDILSVARVALLENIDEGFIVLGLSGTVISMNNAAQRLLGVEYQHFSGQELQKLLLERANYSEGKTNETIFTELSGVGILPVGSGDSMQMHHEIVLPDPENQEQEIYIDLSINNLFDRRNRRRGSLVILRDISQQKQAQNALVQAQRVESAAVLAGGVAHDFNNLLAAITMRHQLAIDALGCTDEPSASGDCLDCLLEAKLSTESVQQALRHLAISRKAVDRAADLTRQLLAYSGKGDFKIEPIELNGLIRENGELLTTAVPLAVDLKLSLAAEPLFIFADKGQLQQVIMNLILNAADAIIQSHGQIDIRTECIEIDYDEAQKYIWKEEPLPGTYACLIVSDTGLGMSPELQARIFDPFFTTKSDGRGLGLAALLGAVHLYNGGIQLVSRENKGTTFRVLLPKVDNPEIPPAKTVPYRRYLEEPSTHTILIADDEEPILDVLDEVLSDIGLQVLTARNGPQAVESYRSHQAEIDIVLLDAKMPILDGVETLSTLRQINPSVCALLSSGFSEQHLSAAVTWDERTDFIQKPYEVEELMEKIEKLLNEVVCPVPSK